MDKIQNKPKIFLDSGAYTAHKMGITINIQDYIHFIKEKGDLFDAYANLDIIDFNGYSASRLTAERTLENQKIMEEAGLHPLPCFHYGEPFEFLKYYVSNYDYLCLGSLRGSKQIPFLNKCFSKYICDTSGKPRVKVHGFGISSIEVILAYPFYSVDSTTWSIAGRFGSIFVPIIRDDKRVYNESPRKIAVSNRNPDQNKIGKHINTMTAMERKLVIDYIQEKGYKLGLSEFTY
jgi:hypothetical protein